MPALSPPLLYIVLALSVFLLILLISVCRLRPLTGRTDTRDVEPVEPMEPMGRVEPVVCDQSEQSREVFVISPRSESAELRMVEALLAAGCTRVTFLGDPLTQELMAITGPEHFITNLMLNQEVKIVLLDGKGEEEGSQVAHRSCLDVR